MAPIQPIYGFDGQMTLSNPNFLFVSVLFAAVFVCTLTMIVVVCTCRGRKKEVPPMPPPNVLQEVQVVPERKEEELMPPEDPVSLKSATSPSLSQRSVNLSTVREGAESLREIKYECEPVVIPKANFQASQSQVDQSIAMNTMKFDDSSCIPADGLTILPKSTKTVRSKSCEDRNVTARISPMQTRSLAVDLSNMSNMSNAKTVKSSHQEVVASA